MLSLLLMHHDFVRTHKSPHMTSVTASRLSDMLRDVNRIMGLIDAGAPPPAKRGPFKDRSAKIPN